MNLTFSLDTRRENFPKTPVEIMYGRFRDHILRPFYRNCWPINEQLTVTFVICQNISIHCCLLVRYMVATDGREEREFRDVLTVKAVLI